MNAAAFPLPSGRLRPRRHAARAGKEISPRISTPCRRLRERGDRALSSRPGAGTRTACVITANSGLEGWLISCSGALVKDPDTGTNVLREVLHPGRRWRTNSSRGASGRVYTVIYYHRDHLFIAHATTGPSFTNPASASAPSCFPATCANCAARRRRRLSGTANRTR